MPIDLAQSSDPPDEQQKHNYKITNVLQIL